MTIKTRAKSRILVAVNEGAADLHRLGIIDERRIRHYHLLCVEPRRDSRRQAVQNHPPVDDE